MARKPNQLVSTPPLIIGGPTPAAAAANVIPAVAAPDETPIELANDIDELGTIQKTLAPYRSLIEREKKLKEKVRAPYSEQDAAKTFEVRGTRYIALLGHRENERHVNYGKLWKLAGVSTMKRIATVTLKSLEPAVAPAVFLEVIEVKPTGTRSLKVLELGAALK